MSKKFVFFILLVLISCTGEEFFAGMAYRLKAEAGLKEIRNALERYMLKKGQYPSEVGWERSLYPYFKKEINPEPKWITEKRMVVMRANTKITQCEGAIRELKRDLVYADSSLQRGISKYLLSIDSAFTYASYEVKEARSYEYRNVASEIKALYDFISKIDVEKKKKEILNSMEREKEELKSLINEIRDNLLIRDELKKTDLVVEETVNALFTHIEKKLDHPLLEVKGKLIPRDTVDTIALYSDNIKGQIDKIIEALNPEGDSILIQQLKNFDQKMFTYVNGKQRISFVERLSESKKKLPVAMELFNSFYTERGEVINANKVLSGYSALGNASSMVKRYEEENDSLPKGNLYELFKEEEAMKELRRDLAKDPYLELTKDGYILKSQALDADSTPLVMVVRFVNNYGELVKECFGEGGGPFYETDETQSTYFLWARARDVEKTIVSTRQKAKGKEE
ncbi:MAG: hypothetical protein ABIN61_02995 [candidate division WOR-3 bacterium]